MPYYRRSTRYSTKAIGRQKFSPFCGSKLLIGNIQGQNNFTNSVGVDLIENTAQSPNFVPPVMKVRHLKVTFSTPPFAANVLPAIASIRLYIVFLPQGVDFIPPVGNQQGLLNGTLSNHPEWIMGQRDVPIRDGTSPISATLNSYQKRNLNSGDKIIAVAQFIYAAGMPAMQVSTLWQYSYSSRSN